MKNWVYLLIALSCPALFADQVTMRNGDHLSGAIVKYDGKNLVLKSEFAGPGHHPLGCRDGDRFLRAAEHRT